MTAKLNLEHILVRINKKINGTWDRNEFTTEEIGFFKQEEGNHCLQDFVIPEDCTIKSMYGQIMNNGGTSQATITIWHGDPSDATDVTLTSLGGAQPNPGGSIVSQKSYIFSKTDYNTNLSAGDIIVPTIHYGAGSLQSFIGSLTVKFVTR